MREDAESRVQGRVSVLEFRQSGPELSVRAGNGLDRGLSLEFRV